MITVWGRATSSNVQLVMWALAEIGLDCERLDVGGAFGKTDTEEYRRMNPNRLVPVLQDGDLTMFESAAIVRYLGAKYGSEQFWPSDPARRGPLDTWAEWIKTTFVPAFMPGVFLALVAQKPEQRNDAAIAASVEKVKPLAKMLDERLAEMKDGYLGGKEPCFADIIVGGPLYRYFTLDFDRAETPHLADYYQRLTQRPAYARHVMVSYESLRAK